MPIFAVGSIEIRLGKRRDFIRAVKGREGAREPLVGAGKRGPEQAPAIPAGLSQNATADYAGDDPGAAASAARTRLAETKSMANLGPTWWRSTSASRNKRKSAGADRAGGGLFSGAGDEERIRSASPTNRRSSTA